MPRPPNPKSKTLQIVACPDPEWEPEFRAMKEICARNGLKLKDEVYNRAVKTFLRDHHWPPGNSQTILFEEPKLVDPFGCGNVLALLPLEKKVKCKLSGKVMWRGFCENSCRENRSRRR